MRLCLVLILLVLANAFCLVASGQAPVRWKNYADSSNGIWFQAPSTALIDRDNELNAVTLYTFVDGVKISVKKQTISGDPQNFVKGLTLPWGLTKSTIQNYKLHTAYVRREDQVLGSDIIVTLYAGTKRSYFVITLTASANRTEMKRFLGTVRFDGSRLYADSGIQDKSVNDDVEVFDTLSASPEVKAALAKKPSGSKPAAKFERLTGLLPFQLDKLSSDVIVLRKPKPSYTDDARQKGIQGTIFVNIQFLANGDIGTITVDDRADRGLAKNVIEVARKIKFIPANAADKNVDVERTIYYSFSIY